MATTELAPAPTGDFGGARRRPPRRVSASVLSDEQLARAVSQGDRGAFTTLYERYRAPLSRYCRSILRHPDDSADVFQNAMTAAFAALEREPPSGPLKPWLYRIAHNESIELIRRRRRAGEELVAEAPEPEAGRGGEVGEQLQALLADLALLPERQRGALLMRELAGLEYDQIGRAFATSAVAARKLVYEGRVTLGAMRDGRDASCELICRQVSDGDGRTLRNRTVRAHLDACQSCAAFVHSLHARREQLALVPALPAAGVGIWLAGSIGGGAGATKALAGGGVVAGGAVAGTGAIGAGAGVSAGGVVSSLGGAMAVKCLAVCGALAVAGASAAIATHAVRRGAPTGTPLISAAVSRQVGAGAGSPAASARSTLATVAASAGSGAAGRGQAAGTRDPHGATRRRRGTGSRRPPGGAATVGGGASGSATPAPAGSGAATTGVTAGATPTATPTTPSVTAAATPSVTATTASSGTGSSATGTGGSSAAAPGALGSGAAGASTGGPGSGASSAAASAGPSGSRTSATAGATLAAAAVKVVETSAEDAGDATATRISSLISSFLAGGSTASRSSGSTTSTATPTSTATGSSTSGTSTTASVSPLSGLFGRF